MLFKGLTNREPTIFHQDHLEKRKWCIVRSKVSGLINSDTWLHYDDLDDDGTDSAYCFTCKTAHRHEQNKLSLAMKI